MNKMTVHVVVYNVDGMNEMFAIHKELEKDEVLSKAKLKSITWREDEDSNLYLHYEVEANSQVITIHGHRLAAVKAISTKTTYILNKGVRISVDYY